MQEFKCLSNENFNESLPLPVSKSTPINSIKKKVKNNINVNIPAPKLIYNKRKHLQRQFGFVFARFWFSLPTFNLRILPTFNPHIICTLSLQRPDVQIFQNSRFCVFWDFSIGGIFWQHIYSRMFILMYRKLASKVSKYCNLFYKSSMSKS